MQQAWPPLNMKYSALAALVEDRVDEDRGLAGRAVADDQLALAAADVRHRVDRLDAGLERLLHGLAVDDSGRLELERARLVALDRRGAPGGAPRGGVAPAA